MKITVKFPDRIEPRQVLEEVADRLAAYTPETATRMTLDFGVDGQGWFKVENS